GFPRLASLMHFLNRLERSFAGAPQSITRPLLMPAKRSPFSLRKFLPEREPSSVATSTVPQRYDPCNRHHLPRVFWGCSLFVREDFRLPTRLVWWDVGFYDRLSIG